MSGELVIKPDVLRLAQCRFDGLSDELTALNSRLASRLEALGEPWGSDSPSRAFAPALVEAVQGYQEAVGHLASHLRLIEDALGALGTGANSGGPEDARTPDHLPDYLRADLAGVAAGEPGGAR